MEFWVAITLLKNPIGDPLISLYNVACKARHRQNYRKWPKLPRPGPYNSLTPKSDQRKNSTKYPAFMGRYLKGQPIIQSASETVKYRLN